MKNENVYEAEILQKLPVEIALMDTSGIYRFVNNNFIPDKEFAKKIIGRNDEYLYQNYKIDKNSLDKRKEIFKSLLEKYNWL